MTEGYELANIAEWYQLLIRLGGATGSHKRWTTCERSCVPQWDATSWRYFVREEGKADHEMTNTSDSSAAPDDSPKPINPPRPKRGAFPTPKSEIEKAKPYIPDADEKEDCPERRPGSADGRRRRKKRLTRPEASRSKRVVLQLQHVRRVTCQTNPRSAARSRRPGALLAAAVPYVALIGAPPNFIVKPQQISMWGNDVHGDCVTAEEAFAKACNNPEIFISDDEVIAWATKHGVLEGAYLTQVMTWMQNDGFADGSVHL